MGLSLPRLLSTILVSGIALNMITTMLLPTTPQRTHELEAPNSKRQSSLRHAILADPDSNLLEDRPEHLGAYLHSSVFGLSHSNWTKNLLSIAPYFLIYSC